MTGYATEVSKGKRFEFGKNRRQFFTMLDEERIARAERSLQSMLVVKDLAGKTFLNIGSGSGLFSLAARREGQLLRQYDLSLRRCFNGTTVSSRHGELAVGHCLLPGPPARGWCLVHSRAHQTE